MGKRFEETFAEPCRFYPDSYHVSANKYEHDEARDLISRELGKKIDQSEMKRLFVRFQFAPEDIRDELGADHCWMVVKEGTKNAQPTWAYEFA